MTTADCIPLNIDCDELHIGKGVVIEPTARIGGVSGRAKKIIIGDYTYIGADVQIMADSFEIGDYGKIHHHTNIHGQSPCTIGHNAWVGQYTIIDTTAGVRIGNNCGIGAHSQLWSHIKYGDTLEGCRFHSSDPLRIDDDVWFVGHCIVSPIHAKNKSMALAGSVVTRTMEANSIYAGTPAKDLTPKLGAPFLDVSLDDKWSALQRIFEEYPGDKTALKIVKYSKEISLDDDSVTFFDCSTRSYTKRNTDQEVSFMRYLLPEKAKFIPV